MRRLLLAFAGLVLAIPMAGSAPPPREAARPLLWKVATGETNVYLLGSFHLLKPSDYPLPSDVEEAFADAEGLMFEVSPEELADPSVPGKMVQLALQPGDAAFGKVASPRVVEKLHAEFAKLGGSAPQLDQLEPWMVGITLVSVLGRTQGYSPDDGLDRHLMQRAKRAGKATAGLESIDSQLRAMDATPISEQLASIEESLGEGGDMGMQLDELHTAWRTADIAKLERLAVTEMRARTPETYRRLNVDRNRAWLPKIERMLAAGKGDDTLVVVGALHLLGPDGLVAQLKSRGLRVDRICTGCAPATAK